MGFSPVMLHCMQNALRQSDSLCDLCLRQAIGFVVQDAAADASAELEQFIVLPDAVSVLHIQRSMHWMSI